MSKTYKKNDMKFKKFKEYEKNNELNKQKKKHIRPKDKYQQVSL